MLVCRAVSLDVITAKRPERKESGEWAKHLRPIRKRFFWKAKRRTTKEQLANYIKTQ
jgi:hypothetical protein